MRKPLALSFRVVSMWVCAACTTAASLPAQPGPVTFVLDMRGAIRAGWFDTATATAGIRGAVEPLSWSRSVPAEDPDGDSLYVVTITFPEAPYGGQPVAYKFKADGTARPNDGWEDGPNSVFSLTEAPQTVARAFGETVRPQAPTYTGTIERHEAFASAPLPPRDLFVYLPPGYGQDTTRRYPVLYLHDGQNIFDVRAAGSEWQVDETAQRLITEGRIEPVIIVGIASTEQRIEEYTHVPHSLRRDLERSGVPQTPDPGDLLLGLTGSYGADSQYALDVIAQDGMLLVRFAGDETTMPLEQEDDSTFLARAARLTFTFHRDAEGRVRALTGYRAPQGGLGDQYGRLLVEAVKPFIDRTYRTRPEAEHTALGGSSLGGLITLYLGLTHADVFGKLLVVSPSVWWSDEDIVAHVRALPGGTDQRIWLDMGTEENGAIESARRLRDALVSKGWVLESELRYVEAEGAAHTEAAWAARVEPMLLFLYGRPPAP